VNVAGQCLTWFADEELIDRFLTHCIVFPYACKAVLRGNALTSSSEEGPRFLQSGMLTDADLGVIVRHGIFPPFTCIDIMRRTMQEELLQSHSKLSSEAVNGAYLAMENSFNELYFNFGACAKIKSTQMPASYTVFMRSFVFFFFIFSTLSWAPTIKYLTPIITCFMVFLINTVIVIGDQMMRPFTLTWSGLPIKKFCVMIEQEVLSVSRRQGDIERLVRS
jgi:predicted membrane chloride channel (bestrophin family)